MPQRLSGIWFKLAEPDGFYLGILMVPLQVALNLEDMGRGRVAATAALPSISSFDPRERLSPAEYTINYIDLVQADHLLRDAIMVFGISASNLNKESGFAFIPSAGRDQEGSLWLRHGTRSGKPF